MVIMDHRVAIVKVIPLANVPQDHVGEHPELTEVVPGANRATRAKLVCGPIGIASLLCGLPFFRLLALEIDGVWVKTPSNSCVCGHEAEID